MKETHSSIPGYEERTDIFLWLKPYVRQCGNAPRPRWKIEARKLLDYLAVYIEKGYGRFIIDGTEYKAEEKDLFWIPPGITHSMEGLSSSMICPFVHFDLIYRYPESHWEFTVPGGMTALRDFQPLIHPPVPESPVTKLKGKYRLYNSKKVGTLINRICLAAAEARPGRTMIMSGITLELIAEILRGTDSGIEPDFSHLPRLEDAAGFLKRNIASDITVKETAERFGFSESHFRKLFRIVYGIPPGEYLRTARLNHAKELMAYSSLILSDIAPRCGFETVHSFSKAFKKKEGISPRMYRRFGSRTKGHGSE